MRQVVDDYTIVADIAHGAYAFTGNSVGLKQIVRHVFKDLSAPRSVLDIGFGVGDLGRIVKVDPDIAHWAVDGIDGFHDACCNTALFGQRWYRNIWHGLAQELPAERLRGYDLICLFDVIEHLDADNAKALLRHLLASLGPDSRLVLSTPLWFWPQSQQNEGDLEEHLIAVTARSLLGLQPVMLHVHGKYLVGTAVFTRSSLDLIDRFVPVTDRGFGLEAGRAELRAFGREADSVLYFVS